MHKNQVHPQSAPKPKKAKAKAKDPARLSESASQLWESQKVYTYVEPIIMAASIWAVLHNPRLTPFGGVLVVRLCIGNEGKSGGCLELLLGAKLSLLFFLLCDDTCFSEVHVLGYRSLFYISFIV